MEKLYFSPSIFEITQTTMKNYLMNCKTSFRIRYHIKQSKIEVLVTRLLFQRRLTLLGDDESYATIRDLIFLSMIL